MGKCEVAHIRQGSNQFVWKCKHMLETPPSSGCHKLIFFRVSEHYAGVGVENVKKPIKFPVNIRSSGVPVIYLTIAYKTTIILYSLQGLHLGAVDLKGNTTTNNLGGESNAPKINDCRFIAPPIASCEAKGVGK